MNPLPAIHFQQHYEPVHALLSVRKVTGNAIPYIHNDLSFEDEIAGEDIWHLIKHTVSSSVSYTSVGPDARKHIHTQTQHSGAGYLTQPNTAGAQGLLNNNKGGSMKQTYTYI